MDTWPERLKRFRNATRLSQAKVARALGIAPASVAQWEIGRSKPSLERLSALSALYNVSLEELCGNDLGSPKEALRHSNCDGNPSLRIPVSGFVAGADRVVIFENGDIQEDGEVQLPFPIYDGIVLRVTGESMVPRYRPGEVIGIRLPGRSCLGLKLIGRDIVAKLVDGQVVLKTVAAGPDHGSFVLTSVNPMVPPIYNPEIEWVAPIDFHMLG